MPDLDECEAPNDCACRECERVAVQAVRPAAGCPRGCPDGECYCPDGSEPRYCGHGPGGTCSQGHCYACDACNCGEDW